MLLGIQLAFLTDGSFDDSLDIFFELQETYGMNACEIQLEASLYQSAVWPWDREAEAKVRDLLRGRVEKLGVHLPFMGLNLISENPRVVEMSKQVFEESFRFAANVGADYVAFHARGERYLKSGKEGSEAGERGTEPEIWAGPVKYLAGLAEQYNIMFCLENADDLHSPGRIEKILQETSGIKFCLDIGHLYERSYPSSLPKKALMYLNDHFSPSPFLLKSGLPVGPYGGWHDALTAFSGRLGCVHIHNHDGVMAHKPLAEGRLDFKSLNKIQDLFIEIPLIIETDYRPYGFNTLNKDIQYIRRIFS